MRAIKNVIGAIPQNASRIRITPQQARQLELELGLNPNSLERRNIMSIADNIVDRNPRAPTSGNDYFLGSGQGLPGGGRELVISRYQVLDKTELDKLLWKWAIDHGRKG